MTPYHDGQGLEVFMFRCHDPEGDWIRDQQDAICTRDEHCAALADAHEPDCPVERRLREEMGGL